jgi:co-chaperonin GroES (HSP10)
MAELNSRVSLRRAAVLLLTAALAAAAVAQTAPQTPAAQAKAVGQIKSISGDTLTLTTDDGKNVSITLAEGVRVVRIAPGQTDLKNATPITPQDLQVGDRVLVRGKASDDAKSLTAAAVIVMKGSDVAAKQQQEKDDWQKRGIGGLVSEVDPTAGTVTISVTTLAGSKKVLIQTNKKTVVRRYAPNSVKFDDAKASKLADIHPGDQLRARGNKNADGTEFAAEKVVSGNFRNIAGTITAVNAADNSLTVMDLLTKKPVVVQVSADSQLRKLPQPMAQRIAMRLKGQTPEGQAAGGAPANAAAGAAPANAAAANPGGSAPQGAPGGAGGYGGGAARGGGGDLQQMLSRLPAMKVDDFQKGDAVILVSTEGTDSAVTAITLVGGVEPILTAAPAGRQAMVLSPWSLGGGAAEAAQ